MACQGRLPIQIAKFERRGFLDSVVAEVRSSSSALGPFALSGAVYLLLLSWLLCFLALRRAFLEGGSGRERSISSSEFSASRLRLLLFGEASSTSTGFSSATPYSLDASLPWTILGLLSLSDFLAAMVLVSDAIAVDSNEDST